MNRQAVIDPMGLLDEPTPEEIKEFEESGYYSMNPYLFMGWLVYHRKKRLEASLPDEFKVDTH